MQTFKTKGFAFYAVEGRGYFPEDMLRYDVSELADAQSDAAIGQYIPERRRVIVKCDESEGFTCARWASFNWIVVACAKTKAELERGLSDNPVPFAPPDGNVLLNGVPYVFKGKPAKAKAKVVSPAPFDTEPDADERHTVEQTFLMLGRLGGNMVESKYRKAWEALRELVK